MLTLFCLALLSQARTLEQSWQVPPMTARIRAYWWWLNGNVTATAITRDLEEMRAKGFGGAILCDAGGADQEETLRCRMGPTFSRPLGARSIAIR